MYAGKFDLLLSDSLQESQRTLLPSAVSQALLHRASQQRRVGQPFEQELRLIEEQLTSHDLYIA